MITLGRRIYTLFACCLLGITVTVGLAAYSSNRLVVSTERLGNVNLASIGLIQDLIARLDRQNSLVNGAPAEIDQSKGKANADAFHQAAPEVQRIIGQLEPLALDAQQQQSLAQLQKDYPAFLAAADKVFKQAADFLQQQALESLQQEAQPVQDRIRNAEKVLAARSLALASAAPAEIAAQARSGRNAVIVIGALCVATGAVAIILLVKRYVVAPLRTVVDDISTTATKSAASAGLVAEASESLASGSSQQAAAVEETSATLEEISSVSKRNAENAESARQLATAARDAAEAGAREMEDLTHAVAEIKAAGDNIANIIKTIDEIAFQTNILALNAAVEAARAGEAGMGFAVVADEVRNLAQRSVTAARETAEKIDRSVRASGRGVEITGKVGGRLTEIVTVARNVDRLVAEIAAASHQQTTGIQQIGSAVSQIENVTQKNAASAESTSSAAHELNTQTAELRGAMVKLWRLVEGSAPRQPTPDAPIRDAAVAATSRNPQPRATPRGRPLALQTGERSPHFS